MKINTFGWIIFIITILLFIPALGTAGNVDFKPGRAPSLGPADAPVIIYEIGDFS